jgi:hypothetical protein
LSRITSSEPIENPTYTEEEASMPRYKYYSYDQAKLLPVSFHKQIFPGTFVYTLSYLIDHEVDISPFEAKYKNDDTGATADTGRKDKVRVISPAT